MNKLFIFLVLGVLLFQFGGIPAGASLPYVKAVDWNSDGRYLLRAFNTNVIEVVDVNTDDVIEHIELDGIFRKFAWNPANPSVFVMAQDSFSTRRPLITVHDALSGAILFTEDYTSGTAIPSGYISAITWNPEGTMLAIGNDFVTPSRLNRHIEVVDAKTGRQVASMSLGIYGSRYLSWSPDGVSLISTTSDGAITAWKAVSGERQYTLTRYPSQMTLYSPGGDWLLGVNTGNASFLQIWNMNTGELAYAVPEIDAISLDWHPESNYFATVTADHELALWTVFGGRVLRVIEFETDVYAVSWSPDGEQLALGTIDGTMIIDFDNI